MQNKAHVASADTMWNCKQMKKKQGAYCDSKHIKEVPSGLRNKQEIIIIILPFSQQKTGATDDSPQHPCPKSTIKGPGGQWRANRQSLSSRKCVEPLSFYPCKDFY